MPQGNENVDCRRRKQPVEQQLALFGPEDLAPAEPQPAPTSRRKRLARPLQALLEVIDKPERPRKPRAHAQDAPAAGQGTSDWLESFFDVTRGA